MLIKKIILTVLSLFPGYVFGMEKNKSNKNVSANDASNHSENREKVSNVNSTYTVSFEDIKQVLITELKQKAALDANPAYQTVNSEEKIKAYFPKLNRISFSLKAEDTLIAHHEANKIHKRSYTPHSSNNNNQSNIEGEWLSSEELYFLVQFEESRKGKPSLPKLGSTRLSLYNCVKR